MSPSLSINRQKYRDEIYSLQNLLSRTQAGPDRTVKKEQEEISPNHVQRTNLISLLADSYCLSVTINPNIYFPLLGNEIKRRHLKQLSSGYSSKAGCLCRGPSSDPSPFLSLIVPLINAVFLFAGKPKKTVFSIVLGERDVRESLPFLKCYSAALRTRLTTNSAGLVLVVVVVAVHFFPPCREPTNQRRRVGSC